jgi:hypothetical protein
MMRGYEAACVYADIAFDGIHGNKLGRSWRSRIYLLLGAPERA